MTIRHGLGEVDKNAYHSTMEHITDQMQEIYEELHTVPIKISTVEKLLEHSLEEPRNISILWGFSNPDGKQRIQKVMFPDGIFYDSKNRKYLTKKINGFALITFAISNRYELNKKGNFQYFLKIPFL